MSLKVKLTIEKQDLMFQEDTACEVTITNQAQTPVDVLLPANAYKMPILKITNVETGAEVICQRPPNMFSREMIVPLPPGQSAKGDFKLFEVAKIDRAGQYDVVCQWEWNGGAGRAMSDPVRITIRDVRPRTVHFASAIGGPSTTHIGAWVNSAVTPPALTLSYLDLGRKPRVAMTRSLGPISAGAQPVVSVPPNGQLAQGMWIAWFDGDKLQIARTSETETGPPDMSQLSLTPLPKAIVAPLNWLPGARGGEGKFFLWQGNNEGTISRFQTVHLDAKGNAEAGGNAILTGSKPVWMQAAFLSDMTSRTYALTQDAGKVTLQGAVWSAQNEAEKTKALVSWPGDFLAGGLMLAADNTVYGAALILESGAQSSRRLLLHNWRHDAQGKFDEGREHDLKRLPAEQVTRAIAGVGIKGEPVALLRMGDGMWESYRLNSGRKLVLDPKAVGDGPINIIFPNSTDPLIEYCDPAKGFYFMKFTGAPAGPPVSG